MTEITARVVYEQTFAPAPEFGVCTFRKVGVAIGDHVLWTGLGGPNEAATAWYHGKTLAEEIARRWNAGEPSDAH